MRTCSVTFAAHPVPKKSFRLSKPLRAIIGEQRMIMKNTLNASVAVGEENYPEWALEERKERSFMKTRESDVT